MTYCYYLYRYPGTQDNAEVQWDAQRWENVDSMNQYSYVL